MIISERKSDAGPDKDIIKKHRSHGKEKRSTKR